MVRHTELALRICFGSILTFVEGCGECGKDLPPPQDYTVTFTTCPADSGALADASMDASTNDAGDASVDAATDAAGDAAVVDAGDASVESDAGNDGGVCFASCQEACVALAPSQPAFNAFCISSDAGADGVVTAHCEIREMCGGRKLEGLAPPGSSSSWLARLAWLEAASVHAFRRLARELRAHGAPAELVERARACARDEIRHARTMSKLARARGAEAPPVEISAALEARDLESIARENAVEGCVGETFGALDAAWHADHERDLEVAEAMRAIAPDELRHAALGWDVAAWLDTRLDSDQRARVRASRDEAARAIVAKSREPHERALAKGLMRQLWAA